MCGDAWQWLVMMTSSSGVMQKKNQCVFGVEKCEVEFNKVGDAWRCWLVMMTSSSGIMLKKLRLWAGLLQPSCTHGSEAVR